MVPVCSLLLISVVRRSRGDRVVELARAAGAQGSTVLLGRGTAKNRILRLLCLADTEKEVVFTIANDVIMPNIIAALRSAPDLCRKMPGIGFTIDVTSFMRPGAAPQTSNEGCPMPKESSVRRQLLCVIANAGFSDDIMHAAREAGARGGTIIRARGTGTEKDGSFFGITIVPEKELVMILATDAEAEKIVPAIRGCSCLAEPGTGIIFSMPVTDFFPLGAANQK